MFVNYTMASSYSNVLNCVCILIRYFGGNVTKRFKPSRFDYTLCIIGCGAIVFKILYLYWVTFIIITVSNCRHSIR